MQEQFEEALGRITVEALYKSLIDTEIVYECLVKNDFAKITLILPEDSHLREILPTQVEKEQLTIPSIH